MAKIHSLFKTESLFILDVTRGGGGALRVEVGSSDTDRGLITLHKRKTVNPNTVANCWKLFQYCIYNF